jgi:citrate synthase
MSTTDGFEGVVVGSTRLSCVRGEEGRLSYAGYDIEELAASATFEEVCHLLWHGSLPDAGAARLLADRINAETWVDDRVLEIARSLAPVAHPMAVLRTAISAIGCSDADGEDSSPEAELRKAMRLTAQVTTITALLGRVRAGHRDVAPRPGLGLAANFLYMLHGQEPEPAVARALDCALVLHAEHGMNASTFAARVAAATMTDMHSAVVAAIGALKGPLHGGAGEHVMRMLLDIGTPERAGPWVCAALDRGERIMGFGHHEYRTIDPRASILESLVRSLQQRDADSQPDAAGTIRRDWLPVSAAVREVMDVEMTARGRQVRPNVDFYSAPLYHVMRIPVELFACMFACARMAGWTAHIMEQHRNNRPIRPVAEYTGPEHRRIEDDNPPAWPRLKPGPGQEQTERGGRPSWPMAT